MVGRGDGSGVGTGVGNGVGVAVVGRGDGTGSGSGDGAAVGKESACAMGTRTASRHSTSPAKLARRGRPRAMPVLRSSAGNRN